MKNYILMGPPGSGKSTQARLLAKKLGLLHLSTGDLVRRVALKNTPLAREVQASIQRGELVSDEVIIQLLREELNRERYRKGVVLDGYPRNLIQARDFDYPLSKVIYLTLPDEVAKERLLKRAKLEGREDDTAPVITHRLELYHQETEPVLNFYRERGVLVEVDARADVETIHQKVMEAVVE